MYKIGDLVVYNQLCVCEILGEESLCFEPLGRKKYYKLCPVLCADKDTFYYVPVDYSSGLRKLLTKDEITEILQKVQKQKVSINNLKKPLLLTAYYKEKFEGGGLEKSLLLLKEIYLKEKSGAKRLNETDIKYRSRAEKIAIEEISIVFGEEPSEIKDRLEKLLKT